MCEATAKKYDFLFHYTSIMSIIQLYREKKNRKWEMKLADDGGLKGHAQKISIHNVLPIIYHREACS